MGDITVIRRYPRPLKLEGKALALRLLRKDDEKALLEFFKRLPVDERQMLKDDVTDPKVIKTWCQRIEVDKVLPILALDGKRIVADVTVHRARGGWSSHVGKLRITIDPAYRGLGLGHAMVKEAIELVPSLGVAILDAEMMSHQKDAIKLFEDLDFVTVATLPQHVVDLTRQPHDLVVLSRTLIPVERLSPDAWRSAEEVDEGGGG